jgi:CheY-like chemotaxis protein
MPQAQSVAAPRILVVEDTATIRDRVVALLAAAGYEVEAAGDGHDGLALLNRHRFNAVVLDLVMPRVDGWRFRDAQLSTPHLAAIPTIVLTVQHLLEAERYALRAPHIVRKPFEDRTLLDALERVGVGPHPRSMTVAKSAVDGFESSLFWSKRGEVACGLHAPDTESSRWVAEGWARMPSRPSRLSYRCQHCGGGTTPLVRRSRQPD